MTVKATAHSEPRDALQHQLSAVGSRILLDDADDKQKVSPPFECSWPSAHGPESQPEQSRHSAHAIDVHVISTRPEGTLGLLPASSLGSLNRVADCEVSLCPPSFDVKVCEQI